MNEEKDNKGQEINNQGQASLSNNISGNQYSLPSAIERLTEALFMVTGLFEENYIKDKIQQNAVEILSLSHELVTLPLSLRHDVVFEMGYLMRETESFIRVSKSNGFISEMNGEILLSEFKKIREKISHRNFVFSTDKNRLSESFFLPKEESTDFSEKDISLGSSRFFNYKDNIESNNQIKDSVKDNIKTNQNVLYGNKGIKSVIGIKRQDVSVNKNNSKNDRRDLILKIINKNKNSTIKDISSMISGCSEKTIQRELSALVGENVLKKTGEKRWTRYFLA